MRVAYGSEVPYGGLGLRVTRPRGIPEKNKQDYTLHPPRANPQILTPNLTPEALKLYPSKTPKPWALNPSAQTLHVTLKLLRSQALNNAWSCLDQSLSQVSDPHGGAGLRGLGFRKLGSRANVHGPGNPTTHQTGNCTSECPRELFVRAVSCSLQGDYLWARSQCFGCRR